MDLRLIEGFYTYTHRETARYDDTPTKLSTVTIVCEDTSLTVP